MGLAQAIRRSYRYFIPPSLLAPRKLVRRLFEPTFFYIIGLTMGMYSYARPGEVEHINTVAMLAMLVLLSLKWWSGASVPNSTPEA